MQMEQMIKHILADLPLSCYNNYHEWGNAYGSLEFTLGPPVATLLPYQVCKHCHARSNQK